jgi:hypothetical protein
MDIENYIFIQLNNDSRFYISKSGNINFLEVHNCCEFSISQTGCGDNGDRSGNWTVAKTLIKEMG